MQLAVHRGQGETVATFMRTFNHAWPATGPSDYIVASGTTDALAEHNVYGDVQLALTDSSGALTKGALGGFFVFVFVWISFATK